MKRYMAFAGDTYYPSGGWGDFIGDFDGLDEAREVCYQAKCDWYHVIDTLGEPREVE